MEAALKPTKADLGHSQGAWPPQLTRVGRPSSTKKPRWNAHPGDARGIGHVGSRNRARPFILAADGQLRRSPAFLD